MLNTQITFTVGDLLYVMFSTLGIIAGIYFILLMREVYIAIKGYNTLYNANKENIDSIINESTEIVKKSNNLLGIVSSDVEIVSSSVSEFIPLIKTLFSFLKPFLKRS